MLVNLNKYFDLKYEDIVRDDDSTMNGLDADIDNGREIKQTVKDNSVSSNDQNHQRTEYERRRNVDTIIHDRCRCVCHPNVNSDRFESFELLLSEIFSEQNLKFIRNITRFAPDSKHLQRLFNSFMIDEHDNVVKRSKTTSMRAIKTTTRKPEVLSPPSWFVASTTQPMVTTTNPSQWQRRTLKLSLPFLATAMLSKIFGHTMYDYIQRRSSPKAKRFDENQWPLSPKLDDEIFRSKNLLYLPIVLNSDDILWPVPHSSLQFIGKGKDGCNSKQNNYDDYYRR
ncbi:hypothetical protein BLA29_002257 [Euroglyphus maynei]|uniref:Uncharacterized protein n=1 Tax=Euroglyphus maynei TaxID=6958 RepID=A0A1Y3BRR4_EURMA|nr:hypothetical protein BLA29_002257 [Euroglyphus maynei]